ncbi:MAG: LCP family protein [Erysipelotrichaceae bacterium]|nr:LCP family protein [Erysipelotrichaceae bacterium]
MTNKFKNVSLSGILYIMTSLLLVFGLFYNRLIPDWISTSLKITTILLLGFVISIKIKRIFILLLSFIMFITSSFLVYTQYSVNRLINTEKIETSIITFVVLKDSSITDLMDTKDLMFGMAVQMELSVASYIKDYLKTKIDTYSLNIVTDDLTNLNSLYNSEIDVMVLDNSMRDSLIDQDPLFESKTKTVATIEKNIIREEISKAADTSKESFIILISGVDSRGTGMVKARARSDVNILLIINPRTHNVLTISIPRDTYVALGCRTGAMDKLTHSGNYGTACTVKTVENLFSIDINYYVKVNFAAFLKIIDVLKTINVDSKVAFTSGANENYNQYTFKIGLNVLNSEQAITFSRERHAFEDGDLQRGLNQQAVIQGVINKITEPSSLLKIEDLIKVASESVETNLTMDSVTSLVRSQIQYNIPWKFTSAALTGKDAYEITYSWGPSPLYVVWPNLKVLANLKKQIAAFKNEEPEELIP